MPKLFDLKKTQKIVSWLAVTAMVCQTFWAGIHFTNASGTKTWSFDATDNYTLASNVSMGTAGGGFATLDLAWTQSTAAISGTAAFTGYDIAEVTSRSRVLFSVGNVTVGPVNSAFRVAYSSDNGSTFNFDSTDPGQIDSGDTWWYTMYEAPSGSDWASLSRVWFGGYYDGRSPNPAVVGYNDSHTSTTDTDTGLCWQKGVQIGAASDKVVAMHVTVVSGASNDPLIVGTENGIISRSTDGGDTWSVVAGLPAGITRINNFTETTVSSTTTVYASVTVNNSTSAIIYSTDAGATWSMAALSAGTFTHTKALNITADPAGFVYATTDAGYVLKSTSAGGTTFNKITVDAEIADADALVANSKGDLFIIDDSGDVWRSVDYSATTGASNFFKSSTTVGTILNSTKLIILSNATFAGLAQITFTNSQARVFVGNYSTSTTPTISNNATDAGQAFSTLSSFAVTFADSSQSTSGSNNVKVRVSNTDAATWLYWDGAAWSASDDPVAKSNTIASVNTNIGSLPAGTFFFQLILNAGSSVTVSDASIDYVTSGGGDNPPPPNPECPTVDNSWPSLRSTSPIHQEENVGTTSDVVIDFDEDMRQKIVSPTLKVSKGDVYMPAEEDIYGGTSYCLGFGCDGNDADNPDLQWNYRWESNGKRLVFYHQLPFAYGTEYTVGLYMAKPQYCYYTSFGGECYLMCMYDSKRVLVPVILGSDGRNPWNFTTAPLRDPDLSSSSKTVNVFDTAIGGKINQTDPGDTLLYRIDVVNSSTSHYPADVTMVDPIPTNTTYDGYVSGGAQYVPNYYDAKTGATYPAIVWSGTLSPGVTQTIEFQAKINLGLGTGTTITNTAYIDDGINPYTYEKTVTTPVIVAPEWIESYKDSYNQRTSETNGLARLGDRLTYTIFLKNTGNVDAVINLSDPIPAHTAYVIGSVTSPDQDGSNPPVYNEIQKKITWFGKIAVGQSKTIKFDVLIDQNTDKISNIAYVSDGSGSQTPWDSFTLIRDTIVSVTTPPPYQNPYIIHTYPKPKSTNVKLLDPLVIEFSRPMEAGSLNYQLDKITTSGTEKVYNNFDKINEADKWSEIWGENSEGIQPAGQISIYPKPSLESGTHYQLKIISGKSAEGLSLGTSGILPNNILDFTTVHPTLHFIKDGLLMLKKDQVSDQITIKLDDWSNYDNSDANNRNYKDYPAEENITVGLYTTSPTGKFDTQANGQFNGSINSVTIPKNANTVSFFYKDSDGNSGDRIVVYANTVPYLVYGDSQQILFANQPGNQIFFNTEPQTIITNEPSNGIDIGVSDPNGNLVNLSKLHTFFLESSSSTGEFLDYFYRPLKKFATYTQDGGTAVMYKLVKLIESPFTTFFYKDSEPGSYTVTVSDGGISTADDAGLVINSSQQTIEVVNPIEEEKPEELDEIKDETKREIDYITIDPTEVTVLPGEVAEFKATGFDTKGEEIDTLKFSWYVVAEGGKILKKGTKSNNHITEFTATGAPGVYYDTVMAAALYNGKIVATTATVKIADVVDYGGPDELPSTGPDGIQLLFMTLTLISAVALAAVEHYEKTAFETPIPKEFRKSKRNK